MKTMRSVVACCVCILFCTVLKAQNIPAYNRFQYHKYSWRVLHTEAFHIYFPQGYDSLASFASVHLPDIAVAVKKAMGAGLQSEPNLVIYPSPDQLYESNIGLYDNKIQTFPTINLKGSRVLVAFEGSYEKFRRQLKEAWVRLTWEEQFKNNAEEQLTGRKQLMPDWFKTGAQLYFTGGWTLRDEGELYERFNEGAFPDYSSYLKKQDGLTGQAFCYFLSIKYRDDAPKQILFQLRQGKTLTRAVRLVTKRPLDTLTGQCYTFYKERFAYANSLMATSADTLKLWLHKRYKGIITSLQYSNDHKHVCYVIQKHNKRLVYVAAIAQLSDDGSKADPFLSYSMPPWIEDYHDNIYPLIQWQESGKGLVLVYPEKGKMMVNRYDLNGKYQESRTLYGVDGVNSIHEWDRVQWLLSAYRRGRSDAVLFDKQKLRYTPLTSDYADHTDMTLSKAGNWIAYRSGYPADSLYHRDTLAKPYGIYSKSIDDDLKSVAKAKDVLVAKDSSYITYKHINSTAFVPLSLSGQMISRKDTEGTKIETVHDIMQLYSIQGPAAASPWLKDFIAQQKKKDSIDALLDQIREKDEPSILKNILSPGNSKAAVQQQRDSIRRTLAYTAKKVKPYILQLHSAYFSAQINNDYFINRYQPFQAYLGTFKFPEVGAMVQGGFSDLFENHHFNIGYRMPAGTEGSDFFVRYQNTARKLDWHMMFFRKVESLQPDQQRDWKDNKGNNYPALAKAKTHYYELGFHYPLAYDIGIDFTAAARRDRTIFLATDRYSLTYEALQSWWGIGNLALQINKLHATSLPFLYKGWEAKLMLDGMISTGKPSTMLYGSQLKLAYHQPIIKGITITGQVQGGYSGGQSHILYNFGGLDNNIVPRVDTSVKFAQSAPYAFQTIITPLRGYQQNSLYGSSFGLLNVDLYVPLFYDLIPLRTGFSALNNLQLGLFTDIATVGDSKGLPAVKTPLYAYGLSARTLLAGYPVRFDMAWPGDFNKKPVWYLSLIF